MELSCSDPTKTSILFTRIHAPSLHFPVNVVRTFMVKLSEIVPVILNWNQPEVTADCIQALVSSGFREDQLIVVDNGSTDGSPELLGARFPQLLVLKNSYNLGFAKGCNVGIRFALEQKAKFLWLLNNDTIPSSDTASEMLALANANPTIGVVGAQLRNSQSPHDLQALGGGWVSPSLGRSRLAHDSTFLQRKWPFISGASMLIRAEVFSDIGLLDENFFFYWEDSDFSLRAKKAGWALGVAENAVLLHHGAASLGAWNPRTSELFSSGAALFFSKHSSFPLWPVLIGLMTRCLRLASLGKFDSIAASISGTLQGFHKAKLIRPDDQSHA